MKLHLPLNLLATLMSALSLWSVSGVSFATGESISINFGSNSGSIGTTQTAGAIGVTGDHWNQFTGSSQTTGQSLTDNSGTSTGSKLTWSSANIYQKGDGTTGDAKLLTGYLDDGGSGVNISVSDIDYLTYGVYIYCNTDTTDANAGFSSKTVNGISYTGSGATTTQGSGAWGSTENHNTIELGKNALYVEGQSSSLLTINSKRADEGSSKNRGCISGIQIVNTYTGTKKAVSLAGGSTSDWTSSSLGGAAWSDSTADAGTYAGITVSGTGAATLNIATGETRTTDAITLTGGDLTVNGGTLALIGPGILRVDSADKKLTINSTLSGKATINGAGTVVFGKNQTLGGLNGAGKLDIGSTTLTIDGTEASSFAGSLIGTASSSLVKKGTGDWFVSNASTNFLGSISIQEGTLKLNTASVAMKNKILGIGNINVTECNADTSNSLNISDFTGILQLNTSGMRFILSSANKNNASTMTIEIGTGAQFWDQSNAGTDLKYNFHITGDSTQGTRDNFGGVRFNNDITLSGNILIDQGAKAMFGNHSGNIATFKGIISGDGNLVVGCGYGGNVSKYVLVGNNTHALTVLGFSGRKAEVTAQNDNALGKAAQFVVNGSKIIVDTANLNLSSLTDTTTSTAALASEIDLKTNTLTVNNTDNSAFNGKITGTGGLVKSGSGILVVGNTVEAQKSTYSGSTIVNKGTLQAKTGTTNAFGTGALVLNGGTLDANSTTLGNTSLTVNGTSTLKGLVVGDKNKALQDIIVSLGNANEVLTLDSTTGVNLVADASAPLLQQGQTISLVSGSAATLANGTLNLAFANAGAFTLDATSSLTLSGTLTLNLVDWTNMVEGQTYIIDLFTKDSANNTFDVTKLQTVSLKMNGGEFTYSDVKNTLSTNGQISFVCGDVPSPSIPEPSTVSLTLLALTGLLLRRRRAN